MLDAPVSGSVPQVQSGTLTIMVGGAEDVYREVEPLLEELGSPNYVGDNGQGLALKLAINISLAVQMLAFAEGLLLAERSGVDRQRALDIMEASPIGSPMLRARASIILDPPDEAWFDLRFMHKDIELALDAARKLRDPACPPPSAPTRCSSRRRRSGTSDATSPPCSRLLNRSPTATVLEECAPGPRRRRDALARARAPKEDGLPPLLDRADGRDRRRRRSRLSAAGTRLRRQHDRQRRLPRIRRRRARAASRSGDRCWRSRASCRAGLRPAASRPASVTTGAASSTPQPRSSSSSARLPSRSRPSQASTSGPAAATP